MKPTVLIDCDGVLADFGGAFLGLIMKETGESFSLNDIDRWDITSCAFFVELEKKHPDLKKRCWDALNRAEFCSKIGVLPGAQGAIERLQAIAQVIVVTSPMGSSPFWMAERTDWLYRLFGIAGNDVIHAGKKHLVHGDVLIDDKASHVRGWHDKWGRTGGHGILWDAPYNQRDTDGTRIRGWRELFPFLRSKLYLSD